MSEIIKRQKALAVSPLKASQTMGAALAFLGMNKAMPLMHGSQGCTAFAKVFFVRHFREPIPLQTTAMDQVSSVMGADENIIEALRVICEKNNPAVIGLITTGLAETQGADIHGAVRIFRQEYPEFNATSVVAVNTPDYSGSFESGYALAVKRILATLVPETKDQQGSRKKQINVLCGANVTPGDIEFIRDSITSFGLRPLLIPDLSESLDGHLDSALVNPLTTGGVGVDEIRTAADSIATFAIGQSMHDAGKFLFNQCGVPVYTFGHLMGLDEVDRWFQTLTELSNEPVPVKWQRQRTQLQDAMLDSHFMIGKTRVAIAAEADLLIGFERLLQSMGALVVASIAPARGAALQDSINTIQIGDLEDLSIQAREEKAQLLLTNSHGVVTAKQLNIPILRIGFPQYDILGGFQRQWFGYQGTTQTLFDLANLCMAHHKEAEPYQSIFAPASKHKKSFVEAV